MHRAMTLADVKAVRVGDCFVQPALGFCDRGRQISPLRQFRRDGEAEQGERRRIDFILASSDLAEQLVDAGWYTGDPFNTMSDHPPTSAWLEWPIEVDVE